ncbi:MAG: Transposase domain, partial [Thermoleophilia bacterium]|nr:Transposase domain [Thermoleophilia bacterium]
IYQQRCHAVESVFGHQQSGLRFNGFSRRGHIAARAEWHLTNAVHNLKKLHFARTRAIQLA